MSATIPQSYGPFTALVSIPLRRAYGRKVNLSQIYKREKLQDIYFLAKMADTFISWTPLILGLISLLHSYLGIQPLPPAATYILLGGGAVLSLWNFSGWTVNAYVEHQASSKKKSSQNSS